MIPGMPGKCAHTDEVERDLSWYLGHFVNFNRST